MSVLFCHAVFRIVVAIGRLRGRGQINFSINAEFPKKNCSIFSCFFAFVLLENSTSSLRLETSDQIGF